MTRSDIHGPPRLKPFAISYSLIVAALLLPFVLGVMAASGMRGYLSGQIEWSNAQKRAVACLERYAASRAEAQYECWVSHRARLLAAQQTREELQKAHPDMRVAYSYLVPGDSQPANALGMSAVFRVLGKHSPITSLLDIWEKADNEMVRLDRLALRLRSLVGAGYAANHPQVVATLSAVNDSDKQLNAIENEFFNALDHSGDRIRSVLLLTVVTCAVLLLCFFLWISSRWIMAWGVAQRLATERAARMRGVAAAAAAVGAVTSLDELDAVLRTAISKALDCDSCTISRYDASTDAFIPEDTTTSGAEPASVIRSPMHSGDRVLGMITVRCHLPNRYTADDVDVIETLTSVAASAAGRIESTQERLVAEEGLRRSEEQLAQAHKMEAVGLLAGGVAHDFNNLLTAIKGNSSLLAEDASLPDDLRDHVDEIARASDRAAALTGQLLAFSRRQVLQPRVLDLNDLVVNMKSLIRRLMGEDVQVQTSFEAELGHVRADPHQMEQVILNLTLNARDAISHRGSMVIETSNVEVTEEIPTMPSIDVGSYVRLTVRDSGVGIGELEIARIFEPFYTTKPVGKGTGLGLSTVYGIVKQSGGHIYVESTRGEGTSMNIYLPRTEEPLDPPLEEMPARPAAVPAQRAAVLVVEDEMTVRTLLARVLAREGYSVMEAGSGEEAMAILNAGITVDVMVTDTVMPGMSGVELAKHALSLRPALAVLHMSGYTDDEVFRRGVSGRGEGFLQKPFPPRVLLDGVAEALNKMAVR